MISKTIIEAAKIAGKDAVRTTAATGLALGSYYLLNKIGEHRFFKEGESSTPANNDNITKTNNTNTNSSSFKFNIFDELSEDTEVAMQPSM
ncbi:hypothetical protein EP47_13895 [Legionella norrlandica]|uniref:Uncharacterized protein n=1 Tax=Legionella norrlandica TaxID=1498499 RepID=A0A0A2SN81_9GAMM|nr:hypothetical protein [Legionella norrlandica]KGP62202.1 hypothetical protein EP47_13895 [Legionella norrlandica]